MRIYGTEQTSQKYMAVLLNQLDETQTEHHTPPPPLPKKKLY